MIQSMTFGRYSTGKFPPPRHIRDKTIQSSFEPHGVLTPCCSFPESIDLRIMRAVGTNLVSAMQRDMNILEVMMKDNMLNDFYATSLGMEEYLQDMARMVGQLSHRYPHMNVLEIGEWPLKSCCLPFTS